MLLMIGSTEPSTKLIDNEEHNITPFFGMDREGEFAQMGIGYVSGTVGASFWGLLAPHMLITSWRAMHILAHLKQIDRNTLSHCWYAAYERDSSDKTKAISKLGEQFDDKKVLEKLLVAVPDAEELDKMLCFVKTRSIDIDAYELRDLVERGLLDDHPIIAELEAKDQAMSNECEARESFIAEPLREEHSLSSLFSLLGIDNMLDGVPSGGYGMDWGHIELGDLDSMIKRTSTGKYASPFAIFHTTMSPETWKTPIGRGGSAMFTTSFGDVEMPYYVDATGTTYAFDKASFRDGEIVVTVQVGEDKGTLQRDMTVAELREAIVVKKQKKRWFRRR